MQSTDSPSPRSRTKLPTPAALNSRRRPGKTRASAGVTLRSWTVPSPGVTKTPTPFGSERSLPSETGVEHPVLEISDEHALA